MNYPDGSKVALGDEVKLWGNCRGVIVASIDDDAYDPQYPKDAWGHLKKGVLIHTEKAGVLHYTDPEEGIIEPVVVLTRYEGSEIAAAE